MSYTTAKDIDDPQECIHQVQRRLTWLSEVGIPQARKPGTHRTVGHCKTDLDRLAELVNQFGEPSD